MADIFGRTELDHYEHYRLMREHEGEGSLKRYIRSLGPDNRVASGVPFGADHRFGELGTYKRATQGPNTLAYLQSNMVAVQAVVDEVLRRGPIFEQVIPITMVPEGAREHGVRIKDYAGDNAPARGLGTDLPTVQVTRTLETYPLDPYGNNAVFDDEDVRNAQFVGIPLQAETVGDAVTVAMTGKDGMNDIAFFGIEASTGRQYQGFINQPSSVITTTTAAHNLASGTTGVDAAAVLTDGMNAIVKAGAGVFGNNITGEMLISMATDPYNFIFSTTMADRGSDLSIAEHVMRHNGWVTASGNTVRIAKVEELDGAGGSNKDRIIISINHDQVYEFPVAFNPRAGIPVRYPTGIAVPVTFKCGPGTFIKRPAGIRYIDMP